MDKMCIKFEKKYNLSIFHKDRLDSHVYEQPSNIGRRWFFCFVL